MPSRVAIAGTSTGHSSMATTSLLPRRWKPRMTPRAVRTAEKTARRRLPGAIGTTGSTAASIPDRAKVFATISRFQAR